MDKILPEAKQWIDEKKDPISARWQAGLRDVMDLFMPDLEKGKLTPVCPLSEKELSIFKAAIVKVDLSPGLFSAFLPPCAANSIFPPDYVKKWMRIKKNKPSYKIIILRPGEEDRILCAEISEYAHRPGVDIFQSGVFLGNFDYETNDICISELPKIIRTHAWGKNKWQRNDYLTYTLNWFERTAYTGKADVIVDKNYSFFHSPTLFKMNRVDAMFMLLYEVMKNRIKNEDPEVLYKALHLPREADGIENTKHKNTKMRLSACEALAESYILNLLTLIKTLKLIDFTSFTNAESHGFQNEFVRTVRKLSSDLENMVFP